MINPRCLLRVLVIGLLSLLLVVVMAVSVFWSVFQSSLFAQIIISVFLIISIALLLVVSIRPQASFAWFILLPVHLFGSLYVNGYKFIFLNTLVITVCILLLVVINLLSLRHL